MIISNFYKNVVYPRLGFQIIKIKSRRNGRFPELDCCLLVISWRSTFPESHCPPDEILKASKSKLIIDAIFTLKDSRLK